jgi:hypothetical protein
VTTPTFTLMSRSVPLGSEVCSNRYTADDKVELPRLGTTAHELRRSPLDHHRVFITSFAAMPTPANLCDVIAVSTGLALVYLSCFGLLPARYRHALLCSRLSARGPTLPLSELTPPVSAPVQFPIAAPTARGLAQSGFNEIAVRHNSGHRNAARSRRNLTIIT